MDSLGVGFFGIGGPVPAGDTKASVQKKCLWNKTLSGLRLRNAALPSMCMILFVTACNNGAIEPTSPANPPPVEKIAESTPAKTATTPPKPDAAGLQPPSEAPTSHLPPVADIEPATGPQARAPLGDDAPPPKPFHETGEIAPVTSRRP